MPNVAFLRLVPVGLLAGLLLLQAPGVDVTGVIKHRPGLGEATPHLDKLLAKADYDRVEPPLPLSGGPAIVNVTVTILELWGIQDKRDEDEEEKLVLDQEEQSSKDEVETFNVDLILSQMWNDPRLTWNPADYDGLERLILSHDEDVDRIWTPDTFWYKINYYIKRQRMRTSMHVHYSGKVMMTQQLVMNLRCTMDLRYFPFDTQHCKLRFGSFSHPLEILNYVWSHNTSSLSESADFLRGEMILIEPEQAVDDNLSSTVVVRDQQPFTQMVITINMRRNRTRYFWTVFVPSAAVAVIAYCSYWIAPYNAPARVSVCVVSSLTSVTLLTGAHDLQSSYMTALEMFVLVHFVFSLIAMVEYTLVHFAFSFAFELHHPNGPSGMKTKQRKAEKRLNILHDLREDHSEASDSVWNPTIPAAPPPREDEVVFSVDELRDFFSVADRQCHNKVSLEDIKKVLPLLGLEAVEKAELRQHFLEAAPGSNGLKDSKEVDGLFLGFQEFVDFLEQAAPAGSPDGAARGVHWPLWQQPLRLRITRYVTWLLSEDPLCLDRFMRVWVFLLEVIWQVFYWNVWLRGWNDAKDAMVARSANYYG